MDAHLGPAYARSFARDHVLSELGGITVEQALAGDFDTKDVWRAVVKSLGLPASAR